MRSKIFLASIVVATFGACWAVRAQLVPNGYDRPMLVGQANRIVSMAPSVTETLFALGLGDRVVGVTRFCDYPPEAQSRARIGGFHDPNIEAVVALRPDLVILLEGQEDNLETCRKLNLPALVVDHKNIDGILDSIATIGRACGASGRAGEILAGIRRRLDAVAARTAGLPRPRVLFAIERTLGTGGIEDVYIAGRDGHIDRIIELAGGRNAYTDGRVRFPAVSAEGIMQMDPEVIVDLVPGLAGGGLDREQLAADWGQLDRVAAVRAGRVCVLDDDFAYKPGPRFILLVEKLARLLHPEVDWQP